MIAIPNMEKPKVCADCSVNDMVCGLWMEVANIKAHRHKDCPLIEIDLIRCGECYWYDKDFKDCNIRDSYGWEYKPTDFCSYGERRTDEEKP